MLALTAAIGWVIPVGFFIILAVITAILAWIAYPRSSSTPPPNRVSRIRVELKELADEEHRTRTSRFSEREIEEQQIRDVALPLEKPVVPEISSLRIPAFDMDTIGVESWITAYFIHWNEVIKNERLFVFLNRVDKEFEEISMNLETHPKTLDKRGMMVTIHLHVQNEKNRHDAEITCVMVLAPATKEEDEELILLSVLHKFKHRPAKEAVAWTFLEENSSAFQPAIET